MQLPVTAVRAPRARNSFQIRDFTVDNFYNPKVAGFVKSLNILFLPGAFATRSSAK